MVNKLVAAGARKYLVVVTPRAVQPKITVPKGYLTEGFLDGRNPDVAFLVGLLLTDRFLVKSVSVYHASWLTGPALNVLRTSRQPR